jgi:hypothetical protein
MASPQRNSPKAAGSAFFGRGHIDRLDHVLHFLAVAFGAPDFLGVVLIHAHNAAELVAASLTLELVIWHRKTFVKPFIKSMIHIVPVRKGLFAL